STVRAANTCTVFVRIRMRSEGIGPSRRARVSSSKALFEARLSNCLGRVRLLKGQKRSPLPPARMSAYIESGMSVQEIASRKLPFIFLNATYMVGDVFPHIHFKKF